MATTYALAPGYAFKWTGDDPETVILPASLEGFEGLADVYMATARKAWHDGTPVVWVDTPEGTYGQTEVAIRNVTREIRSKRRAAGLCPTCGVTRLSKRQLANGHQCNGCADREEGF